MNGRLRFIISGDSAVIVKTGNEISLHLNQMVRKLMILTEKKNMAGITDLIPSYNELMVCYNPFIISLRELLDNLYQLELEYYDIELPGSKVIHVPVLYGGDAGPDLTEVAGYCRLSEDEVIRIHTSVDYMVYMLGFTPGFCYLGGMDERIATPRKLSPRLLIPAGAVGIAEKQTGIYPVESPGGWQLIGQSPLRLFDPGRNPEFLFTQGDYIRFYAVTVHQFEKIRGEINRGIFALKTSEYE